MTPPAGYSGTPLLKKLGVKPGTRLIAVGAPTDFEWGDVPDGVEIKRRAAGEAPVVVLFLRKAAELEKRFPTATKSVAEGGRIWLAWPKKTSALATDIDKEMVRQFGLRSGWVDFKVAALSDDWSGHAFARKKK